MQPTDRPAFNEILVEIFAALDKPLGEGKQEVFWKALSRLSLLDMARIRDELLASLEQSEPPKNFGVAEMWALKRRLRARAPVTVQQAGNWEAALEAEITRLTVGDRQERAAEFAALVRQNVRNWEERRRENPQATRWLVLDAAIARADASGDDSLFVSERLKEYGEMCARFLREDGEAWCGKNHTATRIIRRMLGGHAADRVREAAEAA